LARWKVELKRGGIDDRRRGPRPNPENAELRRLERENARLTAKLKQAELIIEAQKKLAEILGTTLPGLPGEEEMRGAQRDRG
jgi:transposase-like protein